MTGTHVKIGFLSLCLAVLVGAPAVWLAGKGAPVKASTDIAIEHVSPLTVRIDRLVSSGTNVIELGLAGSGSIALHVPRSWSRQEVRGTPIDRVTAEPRDQGFVRWTIPVGATVRFDAVNPGRITLHNPSGIPMAVTVTNVNAKTGTREDDARIVTDEPYVLP